HNNRLFDDTSLSWLLAVKFLRHGNMTIEDIKTYIDLCLLGESTITERYNIISRQREMALRQLEEAKERVEYMEQKAQHYLDYMNGKVSKEIYPEQWLHDNWGVLHGFRYGHVGMTSCFCFWEEVSDIVSGREKGNISRQNAWMCI